MGKAKIKDRPVEKGVNRFNYFFLNGVCPFQKIDSIRLSRAVHDELSDICEQRYSDGDKIALFEFVEQDPFCFHSKWLADVLEEWRRTGRYSECHELMAKYASAKGQRDHKELLKTIERDQEIFRFIVERPGKWNVEKAKREAARMFPVGHDTVDKVYKTYRRWASLQETVEFDDLDSGKETTGESPYLQFYPENKFSMSVFMEYLSQALDNLKVLWGISDDK